MCVPMPRRFELARRGAARRVFAAYPRPVHSKAKVWGGIEGPVRLIIRSAKIPAIIGSAMIGRAGLWPETVAASRPEHAHVLSEHRRGNGGGKNYRSTQCFQFGHLGFSVLV